jgi:LacI family transcriptional regulator
MTIEEIAKLAGVSKTTVSRVLNSKPDVNKATREKILQIIDENDFQPNAFAKAFSLQKSHSIGLIIPYEADYIFSNPFYIEVMRGVSTEINNRGYYLSICYPKDHNYVDMYKQKRVDGYILMSPGSFHSHIIESLNEVKAPFVSTAHIPDYADMISVDVDNYKGGRMLTEYLVGLGHKRIAYIGKLSVTSSTDRLHGYQDILKENKILLDDKLVKISKSGTSDSGYQIMKELLNENRDITAVFAASDIMTGGVIKAIKEAGFSVPEDISVVGFDDIPNSAYADPPLTTIKQPAFEKGVEATKMLIDLIEDEIEPKSKMLDLKLVIRKSTGIAKSR